MSNNILYEEEQEEEEEEEEEEAQNINQEREYEEEEEENLEPTITNVNLNYDRDDSLNDVISFGKQTPFRFEYGSQLIDEVEEEEEEVEDDDDDQEEENKFKKKQKRYIDPNDAITNTSIDLIDERDFMSSSKQQHQPHSHLSSNEFMNALQNQQTFSNLSANDFILNLRDTTIDEIYLIPESIKKKFLSKSIDLREQEHHEQQIESASNLTGLIEADTSAALSKHNLIYQTPPASSRHRLSHSSSRISAVPIKDSNSPNNNNSIVYRSDSKLSTTSPSRIPIAATSLSKSQLRPQSRLSFANYEPRAKLSSSSNQINKPAPSASASTSTNLNNTNISKKWSKSTNLQQRPAFKQNEGAFKFYSNDGKEDLSNRNLRQPANPSASTNTTKPTVSPPAPAPPSARSTAKSSSQDKSRSSPFVSIDKSKKTSATSEAKRTSAMNLNYSIESDESFMLEDLINNPAELKKKLKEGKMDKEQLGQLQQNYIHLLEQYAEKENFIDKFRLGYDWNNFPNSNNNKGINSNKNYNDMINRMSSSNLFSLASPSPKFTQNIDSIQSKLNASNDALRLPDSAIDTYGSPNPPLSTLKSFTPNIDSTLNINNNNNGQSNQGVFVITTASSTSTALNRASSNLFTPEFGQEQQQSALDYNLVSENPNDLLPTDEDILVEQNSKLGILLQTKILEDKMQSFVTLINEKQLNQLEKKQVFESIKTDYENLLKNYQEVKKTDLSGIMPNELDMDIDLNKELSKMKDLLTNIVDKMNTNQTEKSSSASVTSDEVKSSRGSSSASSYGNNNKEELMDQYNRLLDVFNSQSDTVKSKSLEKKQQLQQQQQQSTNAEEEENNSKELSVTLLSSSSQSQSNSSRQKELPSQQQEQHQAFSSSSSRNLSRPSVQHHQKQHTRSPKRTKQQLAPSSNTSSESNKANKKFIQSQSSTEKMVNQPIKNVIINRKQELDKQQLQQQQQFKEGNLLSRPQPRVPPAFSQQLQNNDDDIDYDDIIEVESDLLDNSFIDDDEDEYELEEEEISDEYGHLKSTNNRRGFRYSEQANTESEYENMSSNINSNSNINNNIMRNSSSSHYKSSSSSSSCQKPPSQINNIQLNQNKRASMPIATAAPSELIRPQRAQQANRTHPKSMNSQAHTPYNNEWNLSPRLINTANANLNHMPFDDETDQDKTVLYMNEERKQQLQRNSGLASKGSSVKQKQMIINNFNPSSSSSSNSFLPSQQIRHSQHQPPTADTINSKKMSKKLVAKAYEGSESDEQLESLDQFEKEFVSVKTVSNEANKRHGNHQHHHHHHSNQHRHKQHLNDQINSKPPLRNNEKPKQYESINRRYSSYELCQQATTDVNLHRKSSNRHSKQIRAEKTKSNNFNELSHSTEISSSMIDLNRKSSTKSTRNANKADLMKQLAEEVESLKQQILKKHLGKVKESGVNDEPKKMRKSHSYQSYQALNDDLNSIKTIRPKDTSIKRVKSNSIRHYTHTNSNRGDTDCEKRPSKLTEKQMLSSISLENLNNQACPKNTKSQNDKTKRRSCILSDETTTSSSTHSRNTKPIELITPPDNHLLCYDSHGRLVTILPSNQLNQLNRNSFPLNEIHQNVIEHQLNVANPSTPHYNHMQTQTQSNITSKNLIYPAAVTPQVATALTTQHHLAQVMPVHANLPQFYTQTPSNHPLLNNIPNSNHNNSTQSQSKRRIRYYIREYGDSSDNEAVHNRDLDSDETILPVQIPVVVSCNPVNGYELHELSEDCSAKKNVNSKNICAEDANKLEKVFKKAFKYAHSLNNTSKKLKKKIFNSINV